MITLRTLPLRILAHGGAALALLLTATNAFSYAVEGAKWTLNRTVAMHLSLGPPQTLTDGFTSFNESAANALSIWNGYLVHMKFRPIVDSPLPPADGDADTSVFFANNIYGEPFGERVLAVTLLASRDTVLSSADVLFNNGVRWDSYRGPLGAAWDFHRVALHEFGHALGLDHPDQAGQTVAAIMNSIISNIDSLRPDDINGARSLYDAGPAYLSSDRAPALVNISTRAFVGTDANVLIGGFIVQGSEPATVILRGIGHSLAAQGLGDALADPKIELRDSTGALIASSDDWIGGTDAETIASYHLDPANTRESALLGVLNAGSYTVILSEFDTGHEPLIGTGVIELYDLHKSAGRAGNLSSRGQVRAGDRVMIAGLIIGGSDPKEVVIRGLGPSLAESGILRTLANPLVELRDASGSIVRQNDDWESDPEAAAVQSSGLAPTHSEEAAIHATLSAGAYTAILRGANNGSGIALVEIYDLSPPPP